MLDTLSQLAADGVARAKKLGANEAFVAVRRNAKTEIQRRDGKTERIVESVARSMSVQLYVDGRYSAQTTTDLRPEAIDAFLADAIALTRALEPDPHRSITDPALFPKAQSTIESDDAALAAGLSAAEREAWVATMEEHARKHDKVISATANLTYERSMAACSTSNGFNGTNQGTHISPSVDVTLRDEGDKRAEDGDYAWTRFIGDLPSAASIGDSAIRMASTRLGAKKGPTLKGTMIVDPRVASMLIGRLLQPATGNALQQGRSFWAGKLGQKVLSDKLTIIDDPLLARGLASRPFDGEGIAAARMPIIEAGSLKNAYVDTYYGKKGGLSPTTGSPSNRVVSLGDKDLAGWIAAVNNGVLVTSWLGGNADANTGDFSFGMRGHLVESGKVGGPIGEMNVTGNFITLFAGLAGLGNDPWRYSSTLCPTLVFEGVQFSGA